MFRDKHKDKQYFNRKNEFLIKGITTFLDTAKNIEYDQRSTLDLSLSHFYENLFKANYSSGEDVTNIFDYYVKSLDYYKNQADSNSLLNDIIDYFAIGVLYSERKSEFIDDLKVLYDNLVYTDDLIEYYAAYLFHDKVVPYRSTLEYQNMIGDDFESVEKARGSGITRIPTLHGMRHIIMIIEVTMVTGLLIRRQLVKSKGFLTNA